MSLAVESYLGPYQILSLIGSGAMGEVYRARDTRLGREVAIKIMTRDANETRQRRFEHEARAVSALNHPNILTVHDVGHGDGVAYMVSELVDGESLRKMIRHGALPLRTVLEIGTQIAEGLAAAHEAGIVHRDLKPENIMITRTRRVKILDFGLAKPVLETHFSDSDASLSDQDTAPGLLLGTTAYMSPEQARGRNVSLYSDQFALGAILHEMATGKPVFRRDTPLDTLTAIVTESAPELNVGPVPFRWLVMRCMHKEPDHRYAATADIARELRNIRDHLTQNSTSDSTYALLSVPAAEPVRHRVRRFSPNVLLQIFVVLAALAAGYAAARLLNGAAVDPAREQYTPFATEAGMQTFPAWSPNGRSVAYSAEINGVFQIVVRSRGAAMPTQLTTAAEDCLAPFWSPDGGVVYYISGGARPALWSIGATGGTPQPVFEDVVRAAISADGKILAALRPDERTVTSLWIGLLATRELKRFDQEPLGSTRFLPWSYLAFAPDNKSVGLWTSAVNGPSELWRIPLSASAAERVLPNAPKSRFARDFAWMPDGHRIVFADRTGLSLGSHLWLADLPNGTVDQLTAGVGSELSPAVSSSGREVAFAAASIDYDLVEVSVTSGSFRPLLDSALFEVSPSLSANGELAYVTDRAGVPEIWVRSANSADERPVVTADEFTSGRTLSLLDTAFSPDGRRIAFRRVSDADEAIWITTLAGDPPVRLAPQRESDLQVGPDWSPDGNSIAYSSMRGGQHALMLARVGDARAPAVLAENVGTYPRWSPDGNWIACSGPDEAMTIVSADGKTRKKLGSGVWLVHGWASARTLLGIRRAEPRMLTVSEIDVQSGQERVLSVIGRYPAEYSYGTYTGTPPVRGFSMRPDGRAFVTSVIRPRSDVWILSDRSGSGLSSLFTRPFAR